MGLLFPVVIPRTCQAGPLLQARVTTVGPCYKHWEEEQVTVLKSDPILQQCLGEVCQGKELLLLPFEIHRSIPLA